MTALCRSGKTTSRIWGKWPLSQSLEGDRLHMEKWKDSHRKASQHHEANRANQFPCWLSGKDSACNAEDAGLIPGLGRSPGEGNGNPCQYSPLGNPMNSGAWWATVHGGHKVLEMTERLNTTNSNDDT